MFLSLCVSLGMGYAKRIALLVIRSILTVIRIDAC